MADPTSIKSSPKPPPTNRSRSRTPPSPNAPRLEEVEIDDWAARLNSGGTQRQASEKPPHPFANGAKGWATRPGIRLKTERCGTRPVSAPPAGTPLQLRRCWTGLTRWQLAAHRGRRAFLAGHRKNNVLAVTVEVLI